MPQSTQIAPKWLQPHVMTVINDNTVFVDSTAQPDNSVKFLAVFTSDEGPDNMLIKKDNLQDFIKTYGTSNYAKHGQPLLMPMQELAQGGASVYCMRVMPEDASYANVIVSALYKVVEGEEVEILVKDEDGNPVTKIDDDAASPTYGEEFPVYAKTTGQKLIIKYHADFVESGYRFNSESKEKVENEGFKGAITDTDMKTEFAALGGGKVDENGWTKLPIFYARMAGHGEYGNNYRLRIAPNSSYETDYGFKMFSFDTVSVKNGVNKLATSVGSIVTSTKQDETSFISDVISEADRGEAYMDIQVDESAIATLYNAYTGVLDSYSAGAEYEGEEVEGPITVYPDVPDLDEFDPFFGLLPQSQIAAPAIKIVTSADDEDGYTALETPDDEIYDLGSEIGVPLLGGSDGVFSTADASKEVTKCFVKAFSGNLDPIIMAPRRTPLNIMLDANYPMEVKTAMYQLATLREDCMLVLDSNIVNNRSEIKAVIKRMRPFDSRYVTKEFQHYQIKDPTTKKKVDVTTTYMWASQFASHVRNYGNHIPFVKAYATLTGHVKNSMAPSIELTTTDMELKEELYKNRINYYETIADNTFARSCQNTAQTIDSDLLEENNVRTLLDIKRIIENDCWDNIYNFADAGQRAAFTSFEKAKFESWKGSRIQDMDINFDMNAWEAERSILHCYVSVQFRQLAKRVIVEIDVNKRTGTEA